MQVCRFTQLWVIKARGCCPQKNSRRDYLPSDYRLRASVLKLFDQDNEEPQYAISVWVKISWTWERKRTHRVVSKERLWQSFTEERQSHLTQLWQGFTEEQQDQIHELAMVPKAVWALVAKSQFKLQAAAFQAWRDCNRLLKRLTEIPREANTTAREAMKTTGVACDLQ